MKWNRWKSGYAIAFAAAATVFVLHAPWRGYVIHVFPEVVSTQTVLAACPRIGAGELEGVSAAELDQRFQADLRCATNSSLEPTPQHLRFTRWYSAEPFVPELARLRNVGYCMVAITLLTGVLAGLHRRSLRGARPSPRRSRAPRR